MLIGLMSDSHDNVPYIKKAVDLFNARKVDLVLHAGDIISPFCSKELEKLKAKFVGVFGNNDGEKKAWYEKVTGWGELHEDYWEASLAGERLLLMHAPVNLQELAESGRYGVIIFGHTHTPEKRLISGTLVINPGESGGWLTGRKTAALLELPGNKVEFAEL